MPSPISGRYALSLCKVLIFSFFYIGRTSRSPLYGPVRVTPATLFTININLLFSDYECSHKNMFICACMKDYPPLFLFSAQPFITKHWESSQWRTVYCQRSCSTNVNHYFHLKMSVIAKTWCVCHESVCVF